MWVLSIRKPETFLNISLKFEKMKSLNIFQQWKVMDSIDSLEKNRSVVFLKYFLCTFVKLILFVRVLIGSLGMLLPLVLLSQWQFGKGPTTLWFQKLSFVEGKGWYHPNSWSVAEKIRIPPHPWQFCCVFVLLSSKEHWAWPCFGKT